MPSETLDDVLDVEFNRLRGQLLGLIESWGLPATQERGAKQTLKTLSYEAQKRVKAVATSQ